MKDILAEMDRWRHAGHRIALARVVAVDGSGPRDPGAAMAVNERGEVAGSVSGGCVEGAVVSEALESIRNGRPPQVFTFGYSDAEAFAVGLTCGGTIQVLVDPSLPPYHEALRDAIVSGEPVALATVVEIDLSQTWDQSAQRSSSGLAEGYSIPLSRGSTQVGASILVGLGGSRHGSLGSIDLDRVVCRDAGGALSSGQSTCRNYGICGETHLQAVTVFFEAFAPPPRMLIFGAVDFTAALAKVAKVLGYRITVCDARSTFATQARFPMADEVVAMWPNAYLEGVVPPLEERDAICILTHDPKFDVPALIAALRTRAGYLGALGSRRTHAERCRGLLAAGVQPDELRRIMAPIGVDIGARTPEETAISICAEIIAQRTGQLATSLRDGKGAIHHSSSRAGPETKLASTGP